ncbi:glycosyltransferase [Streptomyces sp. GMR22]|uniref:glycosyltransferase n=1 Tax=Streptomyces sp. GMR22 TaxID=2759524 RepID=UPI0015F9B8EB|nr:glycosyltransferase [Streptomyces sp. GMR22]MBA6438272.1 glycosyltransferase [Streptomyces sp. GMR22]
MSMQRVIPRIIHQTWKDADVPAAWRRWAESWRRHHPGWEYRLWTDADNRAFLAARYPWFLPVYDGYPEPIMRADAVRYFLLDHFGGVYADLDFEALRPLDGLLEGRELVLGLEPEEHTRLLCARRAGLPRVVGNAFLASRPGHPFWAHVHRELVGAHTAPSPLDATGPFFLTRVLDGTPYDDTITVLGPEVLYPKPSPYATEVLGPRTVDLERAHAVHHWSGSWAHDGAFTPRVSEGRAVPFWTSQDLRPCARGTLDLDAQRARWAEGAPAPLVSCLMVTGDRPRLAERAIRCFLTQTYPRAELVVVDDGTDDTLEQHVRTLADPRVRLHRLPPEGRPLGDLRNAAVELATGPYVCQWDDDDLYDPERLDVQMAALLGLGATACFLARERLWWPARRMLAVSGTRVWEGSMVCAKEALPRYPALRHGEDTPVAEQVVRTGRVASVDAPELYTYVHHGENTFDAPHFAGLFDAATQLWTGGDYAPAVRALAARLPVAPADLVHAEHEEPERRHAPDAEAEERAGAPVRCEAGAPVRCEGAAVPRARSRPSVPAERPTVLILTPVRDAAAFLPRHLENLRALDHPREALSLGLLEGDSRDATWELLEDALPALTAEFARVTLVRRHYGLRLAGPRWEPSVQRTRRSVLARARNHLLARALADESWVLWLDADVTDCPPDLVRRLLDADEDIVVPHCVSEPGGPTFDLNTWALTSDAGTLDWDRWLRDGILQPPKGFGRAYLDELRDRERVRVDSVGGAGLLVRADLHRDGLVFPAVPYRRLIETEGLAALAKDMGAACWALPGVEVVHPAHPGDGPLSRAGEAAAESEARGVERR